MATAKNIVEYSPSSSRLRGDAASNAISSLAAWKEFQAGMQILQRYAGRSPANIQHIAKSNLQLLHRSLSFDKLYRSNIENLQQQASKNSIPTQRRIYSGQGLTADLLTLQDGATINLKPLPEHYTMYLLIAGNARLGTKCNNTGLVQHWWNRIGAAGSKDQIRNGTAVICSSYKSKKKMTACGKDCVVLKVNSPTKITPYDMAS